MNLFTAASFPQREFCISTKSRLLTPGPSCQYRDLKFSDGIEQCQVITSFSETNAEPVRGHPDGATSPGDATALHLSSPETGNGKWPSSLHLPAVNRVGAQTRKFPLLPETYVRGVVRRRPREGRHPLEDFPALDPISGTRGPEMPDG